MPRTAPLWGQSDIGWRMDLLLSEHCWEQSHYTWACLGLFNGFIASTPPTKVFRMTGAFDLLI